MKRKGETLTEFLTAMTVFGAISAGIFEFMANQTENLANIRNKDDLMYHAQRFSITSRDSVGVTVDEKEGVSFDLSTNKEILTVKKNGVSLKFQLQP